MASTSLRKKTVKDLTIEEFKNLIQRSIAEDIEAWKSTFEILADKYLMKQIIGAEKARLEGADLDYIPWEKVRAKG